MSGVPMGPAGEAVPIPATQAGPAEAAADGQRAVAGLEPCPHCGTSLALDQRYCLECGAPRTYLSGMLLERLRSPSAQAAPNQPYQPGQPPVPGGAAGAFGTPPSSGSSSWPRGNVLTLIAGIGVLLLAMGVGVLIGRSGGSSAGAPAPQVITVGGAATGAASTATTPATQEATTSTAKSGAAAAAAAAAKHKAKAEEATGVGSSPSKPAPPTALKGLRGGSGQSYEQKSKNLPNVVSTG
jgi:hypothetical protein